MMIVVLDYRAGNLSSVLHALEAIGAAATVTADPRVVATAERIIFPGVGAAGAAMAHLRASFLAGVIRDRIAAGIPFLGICLGAQILFERLEEDGGVDGLGILPGDVRRFRPSDPRDKIPHMGWNQAHMTRPHPLLADVPDNSDFYFVHSYHIVNACSSDTICTTEYAGVTFASMVGRGNVCATQFHPEKSGGTGLRLLVNFVSWDGLLPTTQAGSLSPRPSPTPQDSPC